MSTAEPSFPSLRRAVSFCPPLSSLARAGRRLALGAVLALGLAPPLAAQTLCPEADYPVLYPDAAVFEQALAATRSFEPWQQPLSGLTLPHHLVVPELIAGGYRLASAKRPDRILFLMPDHFRALKAPFGTSARSYQTELGPVAADPAAARLLEAGLVEDSCLFGTDHAIRAHLPFIARLLPDVPVLPVAIALSSTKADWERLAEALAPLVTPQTLIVQSTDFSHYLPAWQARLRDQEVLNLLAAGDPDQIARLRQPEHVDSVGATWLQTVLQKRHFAAGALVLANRNQQELTQRVLGETTSYMVILYGAPELPAPRTPFGGSKVHMIGGDFFLGRIWPRLLVDELAAERTAKAALAATAGLPLILNLEGVLLPEPPTTLPHLTLASPSELALDWARRLRVAGFGLANNHSRDLGDFGAAQTEAALTGAGIQFARQGEALDLGGVRLIALSDFGGKAEVGQITDRLLDRLIHSDPAVPVVAYVHWGEEWRAEPTAREAELALAMSQRGVAAIIGAHPHKASKRPVALAGGATLVLHSLGNFLFDQRSPPASGALAELRSFTQGTIFLRQLPLPALFDIAQGR